MSQAEGPDTLPLKYAAQIAFELNSMRRAGSELAMLILSQKPREDADLEECAWLDEALARAHTVLNSAIEGIRGRHPKGRRTDS
jgi:hypothetical protein